VRVVSWSELDYHIPGQHVDHDLVREDGVDLGSQDTPSHPGLYSCESTPEILGRGSDLGEVVGVAESQHHSEEAEIVVEAPSFEPQFWTERTQDSTELTFFPQRQLWRGADV
jgi:hypothetical protein